MALLALLATGLVGAEPLAVEPLAARSATRGATLFTVLPAAATGVVAENHYADLDRPRSSWASALKT